MRPLSRYTLAVLIPLFSADQVPFRLPPTIRYIKAPREKPGNIARTKGDARPCPVIKYVLASSSATHYLNQNLINESAALYGAASGVNRRRRRRI